MIYNTPTPKQVKYAKDISNRTGIPLPEQTTFNAYRDYIASNKDAPDAPSVSINQGTGEAKVTLFVKKMPANCGECPFYEASAVFDEDALFGDCIVRNCPFGGRIRYFCGVGAQSCRIGGRERRGPSRSTGNGVY